GQQHAGAGATRPAAPAGAIGGEAAGAGGGAGPPGTGGCWDGGGIPFWFFPPPGVGFGGRRGPSPRPGRVGDFAREPCPPPPPHRLNGGDSALMKAATLPEPSAPGYVTLRRYGWTHAQRARCGDRFRS